MIELTAEELKQRFSDNIFKQISATADELGLECYVVGGYVRDIFLQRPSKDIDVVVVGSGIAMAEALGRRLGKGAHVSVFKNFGTAQLKYRGTEVEFVGARKESYTHDSRKPVVEDGTLEDDQNRRDFTINALAVCLNEARYGELVDLHEDYSNAKCYLTDDGMCGFAVEEGGNLVSVFNLNPNNKKEQQGFLYAIRDFAREQGATHLDAYASNKQNLEAIYAKTLGFHVAAEMDYAMEYDHDDIAANHGKPKVVFMVDSAAAERRKFDDYDAAVAYQRGATSAASAASASKVVDENGEPLVVYHGTREHFYEFEHGRAFGSGDIYGYLGHAFYATNDYETAESYADGGYKRTLGLFLNIRNPYETKNPDHTSPAHDGSFAKHLGVSPREVSPTLRQMGHDGVIATDEEAGYIEYAFYHSTQAKSATDGESRYTFPNREQAQGADAGAAEHEAGERAEVFDGGGVSVNGGGAGAD